jgi:hypothetical protein
MHLRLAGSQFPVCVLLIASPLCCCLYCVQGTFLIRYSAEAPGFMAITVLQNGEPAIKHYRIQHKYASAPSFARPSRRLAHTTHTHSLSLSLFACVRDRAGLGFVLGKTEYKSLTSLLKSNREELGLEVRCSLLHLTRRFIFLSSCASHG